MARIIKRMLHGSIKYPWPLWTDGRVWRAKRDADFRCTPAGFRNSLYTQARRQKRKVIVFAKGNIVDFQFFDLPSATTPAATKPVPTPPPPRATKQGTRPPH